MAVRLLFCLCQYWKTGGVCMCSVSPRELSHAQHKRATALTGFPPDFFWEVS